MENQNRKQTIESLQRVLNQIDCQIETCETHLRNVKASSQYLRPVGNVHRTNLYMFKLTLGQLMAGVAEVVHQTAKFSDLQDELKGLENDDEN